MSPPAHGCRTDRCAMHSPMWQYLQVYRSVHWKVLGKVKRERMDSNHH